jgi:hypothetical protein
MSLALPKAGYARNPKKIKKHDLHSGLKLAIYKDNPIL